jgi:hypothetical protein
LSIAVTLGVGARSRMPLTWSRSSTGVFVWIALGSVTVRLSITVPG